MWLHTIDVELSVYIYNIYIYIQNVEVYGRRGIGLDGGTGSLLRLAMHEFTRRPTENPQIAPIEVVEESRQVGSDTLLVLFLSARALQL